MAGFLKKLLPSRNERLVRRYAKTVNEINALEGNIRALGDSELRAKTDEFRTRLAQGESQRALLPEAFAVVREAARRALGMRHFDVQLVGGMVLGDGKIAEMRTGEGKTLVATLPTYLNALGGQGVHVVTVNDYLAGRDAEWMGKVYEFLGLSVGVIVSGQEAEERKAAYAADVTYGTNNEFGFDYLRDNMVLLPEHRVQCRRHFAIVDEVDSILIDEARTPLIISGPMDDRPDLYQRVDKIVARLKPALDEDRGGDYSVEEKSRQVFLTEQGHERIEELLTAGGLLESGGSLYDLANVSLLHHVNAALKARALFRKNVDYLVRGGQVLIVDEFTGRVMSGRRWSEGLHQAVEAKEGVKVQSENQTLASITFQNYFRLYEVLSGMTGTANTEAYEFQQIYGLEVVIVPTHKEMVREDLGDLVYMTAKEKYDAIIADIRDCLDRGQPVLVGTASIEVSEHLSGLLGGEKLKHQVLNAKHHESESRIIANAGRPGTVTIATNMAGRGTDIVLGGAFEDQPTEEPAEEPGDSVRSEAEWRQRHEAVIAAGGLHIIGTERHESRRIDNQLRGRSGRQGDPGSSRFYLSLEDSLLRIFAGDKVKSIMGRLGVQPGEAIEHPWVTRAIENAQGKVEGHNFDIRKSLLEYDDVANEQRKVIYRQRDELLDSDDIRDDVEAIVSDVTGDVVGSHLPEDVIEDDWDIEKLEKVLDKDFKLRCPVREWREQDENLGRDAIVAKAEERAFEVYRDRENTLGPQRLRQVEKILMLQMLDAHWKEHLAAMDYLRQGIGLRSFAQRNPRQEYKREAFEMFEAMLQRVRYGFVSHLLTMRAEVAKEDAAEKKPVLSDKVVYRHDSAAEALRTSGASPVPPPEGRTSVPLESAKKEARKAMRKAVKKASKRLTSEQMRAVGELMSTGHSMEEAVNRIADDAGRSGESPAAGLQTVRRGHPKIGRNDPCHCGSGRKYKHCHGKAA